MKLHQGSIRNMMLDLSGISEAFFMEELNLIDKDWLQIDCDLQIYFELCWGQALEQSGWPYRGV